MDDDRVIGARKLEKECFVTIKGNEDEHIGRKDKVWELVPYVKIRRKSTDLKVTILFTPEKQDMKLREELCFKRKVNEGKELTWDIE